MCEREQPRVGNAKLHLRVIQSFQDLHGRVQLKSEPDTPLISSLDTAITQTLQEQTRLVLAMLTPRERQVLRMRFGIGGTGKDPTGTTLQQSLTPAQVFLIETRALRKLRHPGRTMNLKGVLSR